MFIRHSATSNVPRTLSSCLGLKRYQEARCLHFITFSCYRRAPLLGFPEARRVFEQILERVRQWYGIYVAGYVVMPEHVHLLISEPECHKLCVVIRMLKQNVAQQLKKPRPVSPKNGETRTGHPRSFWFARYYDFNVWSHEKRVEKLSYLHRNPVKQGLVQKPEDWEWSSFRPYAFGVASVVEIESQWTARKREQSGTVGIHEGAPFSSLRFVERQGGDFDLEQ
jgi:putative transposase